MGKIRVKTLGIDELEKAQVRAAKTRKEAKKLVKSHLAKGAHGGERVVSMAPTEEELAKIEVPRENEVSPTLPADKQVSQEEQAKEKTRDTRPKRQRSKRYRDSLTLIDRNRRYPLTDAISLIKKVGAAKFDATLELHINTIEKGISGQVVLPHGTGKKVRVAIADPSADGSFDTLLKNIETGKIEFDVLLATPAAMPRLAKVAKILGPKGLMPNPKSGTISEKPAELAEKYHGGQVGFRTESQAPIIHAVVGKVSFKEKDLAENISALLKAVGPSKIRSAFVKSTMSPGIKLDLTSFTLQ